MKPIQPSSPERSNSVDKLQHPSVPNSSGSPTFAFMINSPLLQEALNKKSLENKNDNVIIKKNDPAIEVAENQATVTKARLNDAQKNITTAIEKLQQPDNPNYETEIKNAQKIVERTEKLIEELKKKKFFHQINQLIDETYQVLAQLKAQINNAPPLQNNDNAKNLSENINIMGNNNDIKPDIKAKPVNSLEIEQQRRRQEKQQAAIQKAEKTASATIQEIDKAINDSNKHFSGLAEEQDLALEEERQHLILEQEKQRLAQEQKKQLAISQATQQALAIIDEIEQITKKLIASIQSLQKNETDLKQLFIDIQEIEKNHDRLSELATIAKNISNDEDLPESLRKLIKEWSNYAIKYNDFAWENLYQTGYPRAFALAYQAANETANNANNIAEQLENLDENELNEIRKLLALDSETHKDNIQLLIEHAHLAANNARRINQTCHPNEEVQQQIAVAAQEADDAANRLQEALNQLPHRINNIKNAKEQERQHIFEVDEKNYFEKIHNNNAIDNIIKNNDEANNELIGGNSYDSLIKKENKVDDSNIDIFPNSLEEKSRQNIFFSNDVSHEKEIIIDSSKKDAEKIDSNDLQNLSHNENINDKRPFALRDSEDNATVTIAHLKNAKIEINNAINNLENVSTIAAHRANNQQPNLTAKILAQSINELQEDNAQRIEQKDEIPINIFSDVSKSVAIDNFIINDDDLFDLSRKSVPLDKIKRALMNYQFYLNQLKNPNSTFANQRKTLQQAIHNGDNIYALNVITPDIARRKSDHHDGIDNHDGIDSRLESQERAIINLQEHLNDINDKLSTINAKLKDIINNEQYDTTTRQQADELLAQSVQEINNNTMIIEDNKILCKEINSLTKKSNNTEVIADSEFTYTTVSHSVDENGKHHLNAIIHSQAHAIANAEPLEVPAGLTGENAELTYTQGKVEGSDKDYLSFKTDNPSSLTLADKTQLAINMVLHYDKTHVINELPLACTEEYTLVQAVLVAKAQGIPADRVIAGVIEGNPPAARLLDVHDIYARASAGNQNHDDPIQKRYQQEIMPALRALDVELTDARNNDIISTTHYNAFAARSLRSELATEHKHSQTYYSNGMAAAGSGIFSHHDENSNLHKIEKPTPFNPEAQIKEVDKYNKEADEATEDLTSNLSKLR